MLRYLLPLGIFFALVFLFIFGLKNDPSYVPSPLIDKPAPAFSLPSLKMPEQTISNSDLHGKVSLINVWASWCAACKVEHPILVKASTENELKLYGLNYKDTREAALNWLKQYKDPYIKSAFDQSGKVGIDYGVYGVPETFVIDKDGIIRYKHVGPVSMDDLNNIIMPMVNELENKS